VARNLTVVVLVLMIAGVACTKFATPVDASAEGPPGAGGAGGTASGSGGTQFDASNEPSSGDMGPPCMALTLKGHTDTVLAVAFSPDGKTLASGSADGSVRVWDSSTGAPAVVLVVPNFGISSVAYSSDGSMLAAGTPAPGYPMLSSDLRVWRTKDWTPLHTLDGRGVAQGSLAFTPDGRYLVGVAVSDGVVKVWDLTQETARDVGTSSKNSYSTTRSPPTGRRSSQPVPTSTSECGTSMVRRSEHSPAG
jgi:WD40 repeat protein